MSHVKMLEVGNATWFTLQEEALCACAIVTTNGLEGEDEGSGYCTPNISIFPDIKFASSASPNTENTTFAPPNHAGTHKSAVLMIVSSWHETNSYLSDGIVSINRGTPAHLRQSSLTVLSLLCRQAA